MNCLMVLFVPTEIDSRLFFFLSESNAFTDNLNIIMTIPGRIFVIGPGYIYLYLYMFMYVYIYIFKVALFLRDSVYLNNV